MKSGKIKLIWSLSITAALLVILLQGYWLYNQYRFTLEKKANETTEQILLAWNDYKTWQKAKLKSQRENLQSYNTNLNQNTTTFYVSEMKESITDWTISIHTIKATGEPVTRLSKKSIDKPEEDEQRKNLLNQIEENLFLAQTTNTVQKDSIKGWEEEELQTDSTLVNTFRFRTSKNDYVASLPGMGLGLSYVKMAVEAHRGTVDVLSKPNYGTTITVKIPQQ